MASDEDPELPERGGTDGRQNARSSVRTETRDAGQTGRRGAKTSSVPEPEKMPGHTRRPIDYLIMVRERWWIGLLAAILLVTPFVYFKSKAPKVYETTATLLFEPDSEQVIAIKEVVDTSLTSEAEARLKTHIETVQSQAFLNYVSDTFTPDELERIIGPYRDPDKPDAQPPSLGQIVRPNLTVGLRRGTYVMGITIQHRVPETAVLIADRYARRYIDFNLARTSTGNQMAIAFLKEQAETLRQSVEQSENDLQQYRRKFNLVSLEENQNVVVERLKGLSQAVLSARVQRLTLDAQREQVDEAIRRKESLLSVAPISNYGAVPGLVQELNRLQANRAIMEQKYFERHPKMQENERAMASLSLLLQENVEKAVTELHKQHQTSIEQEKKLEREMAEAEKEALRLDEIGVQYKALRHKAETARDAYGRVLARLNETAIASKLHNINIKIFDPPWLPFEPVAPKMKKIIVQGVFMGAIIFVAVPLGLGLLNSRLKWAADLESLMNQTLLGEIPRMATVPRRERPMLVSSGKDEAGAEAFRGLYSQLLINSRLAFPKAVLTTSTVPGEGKSMISCNLASTFAAHGKRTLLVDCDFRRPSLHQIFGLEDDRGILAWLQSGEPLDPSIEETQWLGITSVAPNLSLLRAGGNSKKPTELFDQPSFQVLFDVLRTAYDVVLIDTPPVGVFPDALLLARLADELIYVCQFDRVTRKQLFTYLSKLRQTRVPIAGLLLNDVPQGKMSMYYDYYGYGSNGQRAYQLYYSKKR